MVIKTERLLLREMTHSDFDALYAVLADSDIMRHYPYTFDAARVERWINVNIDRCRIFGFGLWAVCLLDGSKMIGDCGLTMQPIHGLIRPEIGYHIRKDMQQKGYASEAAKAVRDWAFEHTPFNMLYSYMTSDNISSQRTAMAYGCSLAETYLDEQGDAISVYALSRAAWESRLLSH